ncbi:MAG: VWA domain-containing protein [Limisphaerales bacterium]
MVVASRFNPPFSKDGIGAVAHGTTHTRQSKSVRYLNPKQRSGHDVKVSVALYPGVKVEKVESVNHRITTSTISGGKKVTLSRFDKIPNKDFVLRFQVAGDTIKSNLRAADSYFSMVLYPPHNLASLPRQSMEMIFVLDCSGSMSGQPIQQAKSAIRAALSKLHPDDTFQVIRFSDNASTFSDRPVTATATNIRRARGYVSNLHGMGGTMMATGIQRALSFHHDENKLRFVCFMTDGHIGNEAQILNLIHQHIGASRIFSFGVGQAPNRFLLHRMAKIGRGAVGFLSLKEDGAQVMDRFFASISHPAMTNLQLDWTGAEVHDVFPARIPDLFVGRPVVVTGRYRGNPPESVRVSGSVGGETQARRVGMYSAGFDSESLPAIWARQKIAHIADQSMTGIGRANAPDRIRQLALDYNLMSAFTSFVAVDAARRTKGTTGTTVHQSVPVPEGTSYQTTVEN